MNLDSIKKIKERYHIKNEEGHYFFEDIRELNARGFASKYLKVSEKDYQISKGKSKIFKTALLIFILAAVVGFASIYFLNDDVAGTGWGQPLILLPRILAIAMVIIGILKLKELNKISAYIVLSKEGIKKDDEIMPWGEMVAGYLKTSPYDSKLYRLLIHTEQSIQEYDLYGIDEIEEDACVIVSKYWMNFGHRDLSQETGKI